MSTNYKVQLYSINNDSIYPRLSTVNLVASDSTTSVSVPFLSGSTVATQFLPEGYLDDALLLSFVQEATATPSNPTAAGQKYYNYQNKKIYTSIASGNSFAWDTENGKTPEKSSIYIAGDTGMIYRYTGSMMGHIYKSVTLVTYSTGIGTPGLNTQIPSEKAVRKAIANKRSEAASYSLPYAKIRNVERPGDNIGGIYQNAFFTLDANDKLVATITGATSYATLPDESSAPYIGSEGTYYVNGEKLYQFMHGYRVTVNDSNVDIEGAMTNLQLKLSAGTGIDPSLNTGSTLSLAQYGTAGGWGLKYVILT